MYRGVTVGVTAMSGLFLF